MHNIFFRIYSLSVFIIVFCSLSFSQTKIDFSSVSGIWKTSNSPYLIENDIKIERGKSLEIEPGVKVIILGNYGISVFGNLTAFGSQQDSILFHPADSVANWKGFIIKRDYMQIDEDSVFFYYAGFTGAKQTDNLPFEQTDWDNGGAFFIKNYNRVQFVHCRFYRNSAAGEGGAIYMQNGGEESRIKFCDFIANSAGENGGAISLKHANITIFSNQFSKNEAGNSGGAIALRNDRAKISYNMLSQNECDENGGAIFVLENSNTQINNNIFHKNRALINGGAIACDFHSEPYIFNNIIRFNLAGKYGGAIHVDDFCYPLNISNNLIYANQATTGGAFSIFNTQVGFFANTIVVNHAYKASAFYFASYVPIFLSDNIIFYNKSQNDSYQIYVERKSSPPFINYTCLQNGELSIYIKDRKLLDGMLKDNISAIPMFSDISKHDYELTLNSPCIDAGPRNDAGMVIPVKEITGKERIYNKIIDMGAYEFIPEDEF